MGRKFWVGLVSGVIVAFAASAAVAWAQQDVVINGIDSSGHVRRVSVSALGSIGGSSTMLGIDTTGTQQNVIVDSKNGAITVYNIGSLAPGIPTNVAVSTGTAAATGLTANACYRLVCNIDVFYRTGTGTPSAVTTDNDLPGKTIERICLTGTATAIAFITANGTGTCKVALVPKVAVN